MFEIRSFQRLRLFALDTMLKDAAELVPSQCCELLVTKRKGHSKRRSLPICCDVFATYQTYQPRKVYCPGKSLDFLLHSAPLSKVDRTGEDTSSEEVFPRRQTNHSHSNFTRQEPSSI